MAASDAPASELVSKGPAPGIENRVRMTTLRMDCDVAIGRAKRRFHAVGTSGVDLGYWRRHNHAHEADSSWRIGSDIDWLRFDRRENGDAHPRFLGPVGPQR